MPTRREFVHWTTTLLASGLVAGEEVLAQNVQGPPATGSDGRGSRPWINASEMPARYIPASPSSAPALHMRSLSKSMSNLLFGSGLTLKPCNLSVRPPA